jgi:hypothetical protein
MIPAPIITKSYADIGKSLKNGKLGPIVPDRIFSATLSKV